MSGLATTVKGDVRHALLLYFLYILALIISHIAVIGLTGGIATGKSTVSKQLAARGIPVIDADVLAREVVSPGTSALKKIISTFGPDILKEDGTLDRAKLGEIVFRDEERRRKLNAIVHPAVRWGMALGILKCWLRGERVCVLDVPLLIESKIHRWVGKVVVVYWCAPFLCRIIPADRRLAQQKYNFSDSCSAIIALAKPHEVGYKRNSQSQRSWSMLTLCWTTRGLRPNSRFKWMDLHDDYISMQGGCGD